jgi:FkbH-like protein
MINFQLDEDLLDKINIEDNENVISITPDRTIKEDLFQSVLDFKIDIVQESGLLNLYLSFNSKLFSKQRMSKFLDEFIHLLQDTVKEPDKYLSQYGNWEKEKTNIKTNDINTESEKPTMPVNICTSFVIEPVEEFMEYWSKEFELNIKINFAPYNQVFQQLLDPGSLLYGSKGINILFIRPEDWLRDKQELTEPEQKEFLDKTCKELKSAIEKLRKQTYIPFLVGIVPVYTISKISDKTAKHINKIIKELDDFFKGQPSFQILDINNIAELYDVEEIHDPASDKMGHMPFTPEYYAALGTYLTRKVSAFINPAYKVIALDCDNTLWKGICGEAGALNVIIDENHKELQEFFIEKYNEGFLLVLCSKNNEEDVWEVFDKNPGMKLKREHIATHRINWDPKPDNLLSVAKELNLGINSFIFVDDNEFETEQMNSNCPDVLSLVLPEDADEFLGFLNHIWAFDFFRITDEDRKRNEMYRVEKLRKEEEGKHGSLDDYLKTLDIKVDIRPIEAKDLERAVQLTLRTNQFNLNGVRKTPEEIAKSIDNENSFCRIIEVKDRFGNYGITGLILANKKESTLEIETFLLSCRVLGRNVEGIILKELENFCASHGLDTIKALFKPTEKNKPIQEFLSNSEWAADPQTNVHCHFIKTSEQIMV